MGVSFKLPKSVLYNIHTFKQRQLCPCLHPLLLEENGIFFEKVKIQS